MTYNDGNVPSALKKMDERFEELYFIEECDHVYHKTCIVEWEKVKKKCPTCNTDYFESASRDEDVIVGESIK